MSLRTKIQLVFGAAPCCPSARLRHANPDTGDGAEVTYSSAGEDRGRCQAHGCSPEGSILHFRRPHAHRWGRSRVLDGVGQTTSAPPFRFAAAGRAGDPERHGELQRMAVAVLAGGALLCRRRTDVHRETSVRDGRRKRPSSLDRITGNGIECFHASMLIL
jgi:hypothetical protein